MADCSSEFNEFLDIIQLGMTKVANLRRSRDAIRDRVINYYRIRGCRFLTSVARVPSKSKRESINQVRTMT
jgi:hypothetical protein